MKEISIILCNDEPICAAEGRPLALKQIKQAQKKSRRYQQNQGHDDDYYNDRFTWHLQKIPFYELPKARVAPGIDKKEIKT